MSNENKELVPKRRFSEFEGTGEWSFVPLNKLAQRRTEKNRSGKLTRVLTNSAEHGVVDQRDFFDKEIAIQGNLESYCVVEKGDFVYNPRISKFAPVGPISKNMLATGVMSPLYTVFRFKSEHDDFYRHYFYSTGWHNYMRQVSSSGARHDRMAISTDGFNAIPLPLAPDAEEQQKIADCLSSLDALISAQAERVEALKTHKKALMQKLFPREGETEPRLRFSGYTNSTDWELLPLEKKVDLLSGFPFKGDDISDDPIGIPLMRGINITEGYVRHSADIDRYFLGNAKTLEKYQLQADDLIIGMDGSKVGKNSALVSEQDAGSLLIQRVARLRTKCKSTIQFIFQHVNSSKFHSYVDRINTSGGIPHISAKQINEFEMYFPPVEEEQQKIADCLSSLDELIAAEADKLEALKIHKKGLMQQLFPVLEVAI